MTPPPVIDAVPTDPVPAIVGPLACCDGLQPGRVDGSATGGGCAALGLLCGWPVTVGGCTALGLGAGGRTVGPITPPDGAGVPGLGSALGAALGMLDAVPEVDVVPDVVPPLVPPVVPPVVPLELAPPDICANALPAVVNSKAAVIVTMR